MSKRHDGDLSLSSFHHRLWSLHQRVMLQFNCYTIFTIQDMHVPKRIDQVIKWFVPADHPMSYEVVRFLEQELEDEKQEPVAVAGTDFPASVVMVRVMPFTGLQPYLEVDGAKKIAKQCLQEFLQNLKKHKQKEQRRNE